MAKKILIPVLLALLCFLNLSSIQFTLSQSTALKISDHHRLSDKLLNKGYGAMGIFDLEQYLDHLLSKASSDGKNITAITIFCPTDKGFTSQNHIGIPTTLLKYHIIPFKVDRKSLESSPVGSTFPTLLDDAPPLVKTLLPYTSEIAINNVKIMDWDIYNDGQVIIQGVDDFFNPAFAVVYPSIVAKQDCPDCGKNVVVDDHRNHHDGSPITRLLLNVLLGVVTLVIFGLLCYRHCFKTWDEYIPLKTSSSDYVPISSFV